MATEKVNISISIAVGLVIWLSFGIGLSSAATVTSVKVTTAPVIDGVSEAVWDQADAATISVSGGANTGSHTIMLKSVYTDDSIYFLAQWNDPTESLQREPWVKQADGTWKQLKDPDDKGGDNSKYYEDKFAQIWNINTAGFDTAGCFVLCHAGEAGKPYGNKYTASPGEMTDLWHMKMVRTNPTGYFDDQFVNSTRYDKDKAPDAGRHSDPGIVPYYNNINAAGNAPNYTSATQPGQMTKTYWILDAEKQPFRDVYKAGDEIAAIIVRPPDGDRADIKGKAVYTDGKWTMEYGRKLVTGSKFDVQFSDMKKEYAFGVAIFDNAQVRHSFESGASKLVFAGQAPAVTTPARTTTPAPTPTTPAFETILAVAALLAALLVRRR